MDSQLSRVIIIIALFDCFFVFSFTFFYLRPVRNCRQQPKMGLSHFLCLSLVELCKGCGHHDGDDDVVVANWTSFLPFDSTFVSLSLHRPSPGS
jgi:hypothetical protein